MGYALHTIEDFGTPFLVVHEQTVFVPPDRFERVRNHARKILFVISGECRHRVMDLAGPGTEVTLRSGDVLALPHRCEQRYTGLQPGQGARLHVVRLAFDPALLPPLPVHHHPGEIEKTEKRDLTTLADAALQELHYFPAGEDATLQETLAQLREEARQQSSDYRLRIHALCASLTVLFARRVLIEREERRDREIPATAAYHAARIKDYLRKHGDRPFRLSEIARHVGLSEEHTARLFRRMTGRTIFEYARRLRIEHAKSLLSTSENNLSEVARLTGFSSLTVFSRNFRREVGVSPSEYRRQIGQQVG